MRISDWSSDVCSSELLGCACQRLARQARIDAALEAIGGIREQLAAATAAGNRGWRKTCRFKKYARAAAVNCAAKTPHHASERDRALVIADQQFVMFTNNRLLVEQLQERKSVVSGKSVSVRVDLGGRRIITKKIQHTSIQ